MFASKVLKSSVLVVFWAFAGMVSFPAQALSAGALLQGIPSLAPMLKEATPAVVSVRVTKQVNMGQGFGPRGLRIPEELRRYFDPRELQPDGGEGMGMQQVGAGSGVIIDAAEGLVVTNHHVIEAADTISVSLVDGRIFTAELVGSDARTDIALLRIEAEKLMALEFADSDSTEIGDFVVAIGNPFGIGQTVTAGIVSALGRAGINSEHYEDFIQTDAAINVGNSGGALVDMEGRLLGINTAIISSNGGGSDGIGFAVPANMVAAVVEHLQRDGEVRRGMLGVQISNVTPEMVESLRLEASRGALVTSVVPGGAAEQAGIRVYDVIVGIDGRQVEDGRQLRNFIGLARLGQEVSLTLYRDGRQQEVKAVIGGSAEVASDPATIPEVLAGARLAGRPAGGIDVLSVEPDSQAWQLGLRAGDVITELNREPAGDVASLNAKLSHLQGYAALTIEREGRPLMLRVA